MNTGADSCPPAGAGDHGLDGVVAARAVHHRVHGAVVEHDDACLRRELVERALGDARRHTKAAHHPDKLRGGLRAARGVRRGDRRAAAGAADVEVRGELE